MMPKQTPAVDSRLRRAIPADRSAWGGLNTSAEFLIAALDTSSEAVALTSGAWSVVKLIALGLARVGRPATIDLWTWTLSRRAIGQLQMWHRDGVGVRLVVDASLWRRQPSYGVLLAAADFHPCYRAASAHAKMAAIAGPQGTIFIGGSGNANLCRRAELVWLSRDPKLANWLRDMTSKAFSALPEGSPRGGDDERLADVLSSAFPRPSVRPYWAHGLPTLGG